MLSQEHKRLARVIATGAILIQWNPNRISLPDTKKELELIKEIKQLDVEKLECAEFKEEPKEPWRRGRPLK